MVRQPREQCCESGMLIPDPNFSIPDPHQRILVFLTQNIVSKLSEILSVMFIPDPDPVSGSLFFTHPGS
jgi:hypothetical protein